MIRRRWCETVSYTHLLRDGFNAEYAQTSVKKAGLSNDQNSTKFNISGLNEGRLKSNKGTFEARATRMSDAVMGAASEARDDNLRFMYDKALPDSVEGNRLNSGAPHAFSAVQPNNRYRNPSHIARPKMIEWNAPLQNSGSAIPNPTAVYSCLLYTSIYTVPMKFISAIVRTC